MQAATHWDALAHVELRGQALQRRAVERDHRGRARDGWGSTRSRPSSAGACCSTSHGPRASTGVEGGYPITGDDLDAAADLGKVKVKSGDIVLVRTGQMQWFLRGRPREVRRPAPAGRRSRPSSGSATTTSPRWPPTTSPSRSTRASART